MSLPPSIRSTTSLLLRSSLLTPPSRLSLHRSLSRSSPDPPTPGTARPRPSPLSPPTTFTTKSSPPPPTRPINDLPETSRAYMGSGRPTTPGLARGEGYARSVGEEEGGVRAGVNGRAAAAGAGAGRGGVNGMAAKFEGPSRPRMVYDRPKEARELPEFKNRWPMYIALASLGLGAWGLFLLHATNSERLSSSVLRQITYQLRNSEEVREVLGERVHYAENSWGFGEPWISGTVNLLSGKVDLKFKIEGSKDKGTVYFTSIRPSETSEFQIVRYKIIADSGQVIHMMQTS